MNTIRLPTDFKELLKLFNSHEVKYLVVGGYAVGYHGYPRATGDIDIWVECTGTNADKVIAALREFGFDVPQLNKELLLKENRVIRMGTPPLRIEILTSISGVVFQECYAEAVAAEADKVNVPFICLKHLLINKKAAGRLKDLTDVEQLGQQA